MNSLVRRHGSEAGIALPITLILMALITSLTVAFLAFTSAEPVIASNQMANAQARAIAESGVERALWALSKGETLPSPVGALADPLPAPVPAPYDGSTYVPVGFGEFKVTVTNGVATNERNITAVGYVPDHTNPIAIKKIQTTVTHVKIPTPPCAICAGGEQPPGTSTQIQIGGSASITASTSNGATYCAGSVPAAAAYAQGTINTNGNPSITGPSAGSAFAQNQPNSSFTSFLFTDNDFATLKALAKANGTYYQGSQTWTSPPPNGIIVVDTPSGNPLSSSSPSSDMVTVDIHGNWSAGWSGWLVVAGSVWISGNAQLTGLVYAQNDITLHGNGGGFVTGAVVSTNRVDTSSTNIDTDDTGNAPVSYNCPAVQSGGGSVPINWFVKPGSFREVAGS
ncbi:MAG TPA: pilus assembly PilX N-terminal domain-containing protein [Vicinamibacterales bacterium]|nr:pilus assembly PilX N-terminal domain-containing protein [Vicinamibacterales bacterium]